MTPSTNFIHLGARIDTLTCQIFLSTERLTSSRSKIKQIISLQRMPLAVLSQLLGKMICLSIVPWARLHSRPLQWLLLPSQKAALSNTNTPLRVPQKVIRSLEWWTSAAMEKGCLFKEPLRLILTTDASLFGWGTHLQSRVTQGCWTSEDLLNDINWLELRVAHLALRHFQQPLSGHHVLLLMDNVTTKVHVNLQGGTRSRSLMHEAVDLSLWAEKHLLFLQAEHISRTSNIQTDWLSRATRPNGSDIQIYFANCQPMSDNHT